MRHIFYWIFFVILITIGTGAFFLYPVVDCASSHAGLIESHLDLCVVPGSDGQLILQQDEVCDEITGDCQYSFHDLNGTPLDLPESITQNLHSFGYPFAFSPGLEYIIYVDPMHQESAVEAPTTIVWRYNLFTEKKQSVMAFPADSTAGVSNFVWSGETKFSFMVVTYGSTPDDAKSVESYTFENPRDEGWEMTENIKNLNFPVECNPIYCEPVIEREDGSVE